jgi:hypothetical protein
MTAQDEILENIFKNCGYKFEYIETNEDPKFSIHHYRFDLS